MDKLFAIAFQANPAMMVVFSPLSGQVITANQSFAEKFELPGGELIGKPFQDLAIWNNPGDVQSMMALLQRDGKVLRREVACRSPHGDQWHIQISATTMMSEQEALAIATIEDITEQKRMAEALHRSEEFYRLLAECAGDVIWVMDLTGRFIYMSHAINYRMGYQPEEVIGQSFALLLTPASADIARKVLEKVAARVHAGQRVGCQHVELQLVPKVGSTYWGEVNFCGMYNAAGEFIGLLGASRDVTDRKLAEEAAHESVRMLTDLAQNIPGATFQLFVLKDGTRGFHYLSPRAQELFDLPMGWRLGLNVHPEDYARLMESVDEATRACSPWSFEGRFLLKSGEVRWFQGLARPTQKDEEMIFNGVLLDITERKQAEEALREADRRKDEFLQMLAHELRNPVAPIGNAVEVMKTAHHNKAVLSRHLTLIERQVKHLSRLLDDLLDVARVTRSTFDLRKEIIELKSVVEQGIETSMVLMGPRKDDFSCKMPDHAILLEADATRLIQAIGNILINATKFSEKGQKISLTASLEPSLAPDRRPEAVILVQDQGLGIAPEILPHIFEYFIQADKSLDRMRGGLGVGLTLTRRIVEMHGGSIQASSPGLGQGSTFCLRLPAIPDQNLSLGQPPLNARQEHQ